MDDRQRVFTGRAQTNFYPGNRIIQYIPVTFACETGDGFGNLVPGGFVTNQVGQRTACTGTTLSVNQQIDALAQFESDSIKMYLAGLGDSATDADVSFFYEYARPDWRTQIRAFMFDRLMNVASENEQYRTQNETDVLATFANALWVQENAGGP